MSHPVKIDRLVCCLAWLLSATSQFPEGSAGAPGYSSINRVVCWRGYSVHQTASWTGVDTAASNGVADTA